MERLVVQDRASFNAADYVIFGLTVFVSSSVGVYFALKGGCQKTTSEFLVGNRNLNVIPVALSLLVSFESSVVMLGVPAELYGHGTQYFMAYVGLLLPFIWVSQVVVPMIHPLNITSTYQYLELRYRSRKVRVMASGLGILYQTVYMGIVLFGPATALEAASRFPVSYSVIILAAASVFYTSLGGIKAVIWTDTLQLVIMVGGVLAVIVMGCVYVGGFDRMWQLNVDGGRVKFFDFDPNPLVRNTFWTLVVGSVINFLEMGFNQTTVQRVVSLRKLSHAKFIVLMLSPGFFLIGTLICIEGMIPYAYFAHTECDPFGAKILSNTNQVLPYVVTALFRSLPGLPGLYFAALFSASLSTLSSCLTSISALMWTDFLQTHMKNVSETKATIAAKIVVVVFGGISVAVAFMIMAISGPLQQIYRSVIGSISGPLTGMFLAGCLFPFNSIGAITGALVSCALGIWMSLGSSFSPYTLKTPYLPPASTRNCYVNGTYNHTDLATFVTNETTMEMEMSALTTFYSISYHYRGTIGMVSCVLIALLVSVITGGCKTADKVDPKYLVHLWDNMCCCLPEACLKRLRFKGHTRLNLSSTVQRTVEEVRKKWQDLRSQVKKRLAEQKRLSSMTGGGPPPPPLNELEEEVASTIPECQVTGIEGGMESAFDSEMQSSSAEMITDTESDLFETQVFTPVTTPALPLQDATCSETNSLATKVCSSRSAKQRKRPNVQDKQYFAHIFVDLKRKKMKDSQKMNTELLAIERRKAEALEKIAESLAAIAARHTTGHSESQTLSLSPIIKLF